MANIIKITKKHGQGQDMKFLIKNILSNFSFNQNTKPIKCPDYFKQNILYTYSNKFYSKETKQKPILDLKKKENFKFNFKEFIENFQLFEMNINNRKLDVKASVIKDLYNDYKIKTDELNLMRRRQNELKNQSKKFAVSGEKLSNNILKDQVKNNESINVLIKELDEIETEMMEEAMFVPNLTSPESPVGDESKNKLIYLYPESTNNNNPSVISHEYIEMLKEKYKNNVSHLDIIEKYNLVDFDNAVKVSGSKFTYFKNELVFLELALIQFALNKLKNRNFKVIATPELVKNEVIQGCGFSPRDPSKNQIYRIDDNELSLIGTSEISIMGILANEIVNKKDLPIKYAGLSHCFRREAGRGSSSKGLYRLHQFTKIEMFSFTENNIRTSEKAQLEMVEIQKEIYQELGLDYRVLEMATEELGASAYRKFDIEAWFPSLQNYGEISSCSNCTDYQSRRLLAQYWDSDKTSDKPIKNFLHSINGTAIAVPRIIMAILECHQNSDKEVIIPKCLEPYMCGILKIG